MSRASESIVSDEELSDQQHGSRKKRKLSVKPIKSRIKAKGTGPTPITSAPEILSMPDSLSEGHQKTTFSSLDVDSWLIASLASMEIKKPTGIQRACIPEILKGRDCIGGSRTGTGKTVAFSIPILQKWAQDPMGIYALILTCVDSFLSAFRSLI